MKTRTDLFLMVLLSLVLIFSGCASKPKYRPPCTVKLKIYVSEKTDLATKHFQAGKEDYLDFRFYDSIQHLYRAIAHETSNRNKARSYLYIGANYFYLGDARLARYSFSRAKKCDPLFRPQPSEFPSEVIRLYERAP